MSSTYLRLLNEKRCWKAFKQCDHKCADALLPALYSDGKLNSFLAWKVCGGCDC